MQDQVSIPHEFDALDVSDRAIDSHIKNLRKKLAAAAIASEG